MAEDARVGIEIEADDETEDAFREAEERIDSLGEHAERAGAVGFRELANGAAEASRTLQDAYGAMTRLDLVQITVEQSTDRVRASQERYNEAVSRFGRDSDQAVSASRELESAQSNLEKTTLRANLSLGLVVASSLQMSVTAIPAAIAALEGLTVASGAAATAAGILSVTLTAGAAAIGIVAGITAISMAMNGLESSTKLATSGLVGWETELQRSRAAMKEHGEGINEWRDLIRREDTWEQERKDIAAVGEAMVNVISKQDELAKDYVAKESYKAKITSQNVEAITAIQVEAMQTIAAADARLRGRLSSGERASLQDAKAAAEQRVNDTTEALDTIQKEHEDAARATHTAWSSSFREVGIDFSKMTTVMLQEIARIGDAASAATAMDELGRRTQQVAVLESALATASNETRAALLAQASTAVDKTGKHVLLQQALADGRITEEEYRKAVEGSDNAMKSHASTAASMATGGGTAGGGRLPFSLGGYADLATSSLMGQSSIFRGTPGAGHLDEHQDLSSATMSRVDRHVLVGAAAPNTVDAARDELQLLLSMNPGAMGHPEVAAYFQWLNSVASSTHHKLQSSATTQLRNAALPFLAAAQGFHGDVSQPTLMLVGEAGRERVDVTPRGAGGGRGSSASIVQNLHFYGRADPVAVQAAARRGMTLAQIRMGVQGRR